MVITGPSKANVTANPPSPPPLSAPTAVILSIHFDLVAHTYSIMYSSGRSVQSITDPSFQANLELAIKSLVEGDQGWAAGSSTITTP